MNEDDLVWNTAGDLAPEVNLLNTQMFLTMLQRFEAVAGQDRVRQAVEIFNNPDTEYLYRHEALEVVAAALFPNHGRAKIPSDTLPPPGDRAFRPCGECNAVPTTLVVTKLPERELRDYLCEDCAARAGVNFVPPGE